MRSSAPSSRPTLQRRRDRRLTQASERLPKSVRGRRFAMADVRRSPTSSSRPRGRRRSTPAAQLVPAAAEPRVLVEREYVAEQADHGADGRPREPRRAGVRRAAGLRRHPRRRLPLPDVPDDPREEQPRLLRIGVARPAARRALHVVRHRRGRPRPGGRADRGGDRVAARGAAARPGARADAAAHDLGGARMFDSAGGIVETLEAGLWRARGRSTRSAARSPP